MIEIYSKTIVKTDSFHVFIFVSVFVFIFLTKYIFVLSVFVLYVWIQTKHNYKKDSIW
jgi:hypothetical protein